MRVRVVLVAIVAALAARSAFAQRYAGVDAATGVVATTIVPAGGAYLDGSKGVLRTTSVVAEAQLFGARGADGVEIVALGGVRQRLFATPKGELYAQLLFGAATGYPRRCDLCTTDVTQVGLGTSVALSERWGIRIRGDIRTGGSAADLFYPTLGVGVTRRWP
jgi:hypothetical protein